MVRRVLETRHSVSRVADAFATTSKTVKKWVVRFQAAGPGGLEDRSSRPLRLRKPTPPQTVEQIIALRRQRWCGEQIAKESGVSPATVSRILRAARLSRMRDLEPVEPIIRYERDHPGELIHLDIKKLGRFDRTGHRITGKQTGNAHSRGSGWEFVHVSIDDASRLAFSQILPDETRDTRSRF
jgi:transcriptional regulator with XRE-family HTH domain